MAQSSAVPGEARRSRRSWLRKNHGLVAQRCSTNNRQATRRARSETKASFRAPHHWSGIDRALFEQPRTFSRELRSTCRRFIQSRVGDIRSTGNHHGKSSGIWCHPGLPRPRWAPCGSTPDDFSLGGGRSAGGANFRRSLGWGRRLLENGGSGSGRHGEGPHHRQIWRDGESRRKPLLECGQGPLKANTNNPVRSRPAMLERGRD